MKKIRSTLETKLGDTEIRRAWRKHLIHWQMPKGGRRRQLFGGTVDDITTENFFLSFIDWIDRDSKQAEEKAAAQSASVDAKNPVLQKLLAHVEAKPDPIDKHIDWPKVYHAGGRSRFASLIGQPGFDKVVQFVRTERNNARGEKQEREIKKIFATKTLDEWQQIIPNDVGLGNQLSRNKYREHVKSVLEDGLKKQERMAAYARWYPDSKPENVPAPKTFFDWQTWVLTKADYDKLENIIEDIFGCSMRPVNMMGADGERKGSEEAKRLRCYLHEIATDYDAGKLTPARLADYYQATFFYFDRDDECTGDNAGMNVSFYNQLYENERKLKDVSQQNRGSDGITDWRGNLSSAGQVAHEPT